jgi:hypothetical protein
MSTRSAGTVWNYFQTERGKTLRVRHDPEGSLRIDMLKDGVWSEAPRGMIGLRLSAGSRDLTPAEISALPLP